MSTKHSQYQLSAQQLSQIPLSLTEEASVITTSPTLAINEAVMKRRAEGKEILHLGFGEAMFPLHPRLRHALAESAKQTAYAPVLGIPKLRVAIAEYLKRTRQLACSAEHIAVGPGSKSLLYALFQVLEGDLLLPVPSWVSYAPQAKLAGKQVIDVETDTKDCHRITAQKLTEALQVARSKGANPRILLVNSPSNPTGSMFSSDEVEAIARWAREAGITLISDEIYAEVAHGWREHVSPACFYPEGTIVTGGMSKAFSAGGWRLGYALLPPTEQGLRVMNALRSLASEIWSSTAMPVQEAAIVAFSSDTELEKYVRRSALVHGFVVSWLYEILTDLHIPCPHPAGAFYLYPDFSPWRDALLKVGVRTSQELALYLLNEWNIATLPGSAFGEQPEVLRLRLATSMLYSPASITGDEREQLLRDILQQADDLARHGQGDERKQLFPEVERVRERFTEVIGFLSKV